MGQGAWDEMTATEDVIGRDKAEGAVIDISPLQPVEAASLETSGSCRIEIKPAHPDDVNELRRHQYFMESIKCD